MLYHIFTKCGFLKFQKTTLAVYSIYSLNHSIIQVHNGHLYDQIKFYQQLPQKRLEDVLGALWQERAILCHELVTEHLPDPGHLGSYLARKATDAAKDHGPQPGGLSPLN